MCMYVCMQSTLIVSAPSVICSVYTCVYVSM